MGAGTLWRPAQEHLAEAQLFAESATRFFLKVVDAQIEFAKDGTGAITGLTLHLPQGDLKAERK